MYVYHSLNDFMSKYLDQGVELREVGDVGGEGGIENTIDPLDNLVGMTTSSVGDLVP